MLMSAPRATTRRTARDFLAGGMIIAINMAYRAMPIADSIDCGIIEPHSAPSAVPPTQPVNEQSISPAIYLKFKSQYLLTATAKISSVLPNAIISFFHMLTFSSRCESEIDIKTYLALIIRSVKAISAIDAPAAINVVPTNCPVPVKFEREVTIGAHIGNPLLTASIPKAKETDR